MSTRGFRRGNRRGALTCSVLASVFGGCGSHTELESSIEPQDAMACLAGNPTGGASLAPDSPTRSCLRVPRGESCPSQDDASYGQDANYEIRVPTYTPTADTVFDSVTMLTWQRAAGPDAFPSSTSAEGYCSSLSLAGHDDWRLPTQLELVTILDYGRESPAMDTDAFFPSPAGTVDTNCLWSSSVARGDLAGTVCPESGLTAAAFVASNYARCVRGAAPSSGYVVRGGGATALDMKTGLEWQRALDARKIPWEAALSYCRGLRLAGACDWRVPSIKELLTIVEDSTASPPVDAVAFPGAPTDPLWSSTLTKGSPGDGDEWVVLFQEGIGDPHDYPGKAVPYVAGELQVRCVR